MNQENDANFDVLCVHKLQKICNPFGSDIWGKNIKISYKDVRNALNENKTLSSPYSASLDTPKWTKRNHIERIAYLVLNFDHSPIEIDVGVPSLGCCPEWIVEDGNHRLAAAIFRGDDSILATCSGEVGLIDDLKP